ncbi:carbon-nitrogen hydrolase family protein [Synechococcus sp. J7-Johnson]|uniref:carbon-nitrogen hydrolase family protein n=1 Tax=Synechococcus sp. J7-Johnson TaxID=2823737 RepID=UPI0020CBBAAC|nr:carbon-nitrogen hydrolase family protein [Synechococcus sp. J7-Johnson]MCP9841640.1 carbon-nitrogen hydrolase family protein [Synechococcus sp. J7-Johnson]
MDLNYRLHGFLRPEPPAWGQGLRLGIWQGTGAAATSTAVAENLERLEAVCAIAVERQVQLLAFPELYLSGYIVTPELARRLAEPVDGPSLQRVAAAARLHNLALACPYPERAQVAGEERFYDAIALFGPDGTLLRNYRKTHLWGPDEKLCWSPGYVHREEGPAFTVQEVNGFPLGLLNCYEAEFPELTRSLALLGAKLVLIPTAADAWALLSNGQHTDRAYPDVSRTLIPAHAFQNSCFVAYANRCGEETVNGTVMAAYLGNSIICGPHGDVLVAARGEPTLLLADCIPSEYGLTHPTGTSYHADLRLDLYSQVHLPRPPQSARPPWSSASRGPLSS